ncbi:hypothetical protein GGR39_001850 [Novosphingobium fluoreni]|uniref:Integrase DNA-binding domain-containing protein n=1 Tax=Novosphingobium fluoreni TaxID=1391222 RepID=A0A7W6FYL9_9SPHN|nr:Arm DNA-binding domain-containing protein [Novosphingobium fluoreni]MBB3940200.1 hypothetical protein [Novosphingobium fluoreni]
MLTDATIRRIKPEAKSYKVADMHGLYLLVLPSGGRYWRLDYRHEGKRGTMALFQRGGDRAWLPRNG